MTDTKLKEINLKKLTVKDLSELKKISRETYFNTFSWGNSEQNMLSYLNFAFNDKKLASELNEKQSNFYFAEHNSKTLGYIKINFGTAQTDLNDDKAMELEHIYVLKKFQGQNIGKQLLKKAIEIGKEKKASYIWLGVWEKNLKAIEFYKKNGFTIFTSHPFKMGNETQIDLLMKLSLD